VYSYEDRLRAVHLYIKLGKRVGLTIRQLGYPTKNALKTQYREYEQHRDLPVGYPAVQIGATGWRAACTRRRQCSACTIT